MRQLDALLAGIVIGVALGVALFLMAYPTLPRCEEDQVLVGSGSFMHGQWSAYRCGPAEDDYHG